jgi:hypothetical protein
MNKLLAMLAVGIIGGIVGFGCAPFQKGSTEVKYEPDTPAVMKTADVSGTYALYASDDLDPKVKEFVEKGEQLGFEMNEKTGKIIAMAGDQKWELEPGNTYYWRKL